MTRPSLMKSLVENDALSLALFLGSFAGGYKGIVYALRNVRKNSGKKADTQNSFIAGFLAGFAIVLVSKKQRRQSIMLYFLIRALQFNGAWIIKKWGEKHKEDHSEGKQWGTRLINCFQKRPTSHVMMLSSALISLAYFLDRNALSKSFFKFLVKQSLMGRHKKDEEAFAASALGKTIHTLANEEIKATIIPENITSRDFLIDYMNSGTGKLIPADLHHHHIVCAVQHPFSESCNMASIMRVKIELVRAFKIFAPLNFVSLFFFQSKELKTDYLKVLKKFTVSSLESSLFLTAFTATSLGPLCVLRKFTGKDIPLFYILNFIICSSPGLIETGGHQLEMGLYCLARATEALWKTMTRHGYIKNTSHVEVPLFMLSIATIMSIYQSDKSIISSQYLPLIGKVFGES